MHAYGTTTLLPDAAPSLPRPHACARARASGPVPRLSSRFAFLPHTQPSRLSFYVLLSAALPHPPPRVCPQMALDDYGLDEISALFSAAKVTALLQVTRRSHHLAPPSPWERDVSSPLGFQRFHVQMHPPPRGALLRLGKCSSRMCVALSACRNEPPRLIKATRYNGVNPHSPALATCM